MSWALTSWYDTIMIKIIVGQRSGHRGYDTPADHKRAIKALAKMGYNYFVCYRDVQSEFALTFGNAVWVKPGQIHVDW